jgi:hypothetical protein
MSCGSPRKRREKGTLGIFKEITAKNIVKLMKDIHIKYSPK